MACATLSVSRHGGRIDNVATGADCRRKGYGGAVTRFALAEARRLGCAMVCLETSEEGFSLYRRLGFRVACLRQVYELSRP